MSAAVQRTRLINTARALLHSRRLTELTLSDVAPGRNAKFGLSLFGHRGLYGHLLLILHREVQVALAIAGRTVCVWTVVARLIERGVRTSRDQTRNSYSSTRRPRRI